MVVMAVEIASSLRSSQCQPIWQSLRAKRSNLDEVSAPLSPSALPQKDRAAVDYGALDAALHRAAVERSVFRFGAELVGADAPWRVGVEDHQIGRRARPHAAGREAQDACRVDRPASQAPRHTQGG